MKKKGTFVIMIMLTASLLLAGCGGSKPSDNSAASGSPAESSAPAANPSDSSSKESAASEPAATEPAATEPAAGISETVPAEELSGEMLIGYHTAVLVDFGDEGREYFGKFNSGMKFDHITDDHGVEYSSSVVPFSVIGRRNCLQLSEIGKGSSDAAKEFYKDPEGIKKSVLEKYGDEGYLNFLKLIGTPYLAMTFSDEDGEKATWHPSNYVYEVQGNKLYCGEILGIDEKTLALSVRDRSEWDEYTFGFNGLNLVIGKDGVQKELLCNYNVNKEKGGMLSVMGYSADSSSRAGDIIHIGHQDNNGSVTDNIWFSDGSRAIDPVVKVEEPNKLTISWSGKKFIKDGKQEEVSEPGEISGEWLDSMGSSGFLFKVDGKWCNYQAWEDEYKYMILGKSLEDSTGAADMTADKQSELKSEQNDLVKRLKEAFDKAGISAEIDSDTGIITLNTNILYAFDDASLSDEGKEYLDSFLNAAMPVISETIQEGIVAKINVEGHTDTDGEFEYNQALSEDRAQSVVEYIVSQYPELESTITSKGYSFLNPILKENGEVDMEASRRVEFRFVLKTGS